MSKPPNNVWKLSDTLSLCEYTAPPDWHYQTGNYGFWLYDETRGMNLSMRAKTAEDAYLETIQYYQKRLAEVERCHDSLQSRVNAFVSQFSNPEEEE